MALLDKYRALETVRQSESQRMLIPETFDLTSAQAAAFDGIAHACLGVPPYEVNDG